MGLASTAAWMFLPLAICTPLHPLGLGLGDGEGLGLGDGEGLGLGDGEGVGLGDGVGLGFGVGEADDRATVKLAETS